MGALRWALLWYCSLALWQRHQSSKSTGLYTPDCIPCEILEMHMVKPPAAIARSCLTQSACGGGSTGGGAPAAEVTPAKALQCSHAWAAHLQQAHELEDDVPLDSSSQLTGEVFARLAAPQDAVHSLQLGMQDLAEGFLTCREVQYWQYDNLGCSLATRPACSCMNVFTTAYASECRLCISLLYVLCMLYAKDCG